MRGVVLLLAVTGCDLTFGLPTLPAPTEVRDAPALDTAPDAVIDAGPDSDGDGIADATDNCIQTPNSSQHDEDGDGVGDICDNCPALVNPAQQNGDGDDVGDACDTSNARDCIVRFDGFATMSDWVGMRGTWMVDNDELVQTDPEVVQGYAITTATFTKPRVEIAARPIAFSVVASNTHHIGVWPEATPTQFALPDGVVVEVFDSAGVTYLNTSAVASGGATMLVGFATLSPQTAMLVGAEVRATADFRSAPTWISRGDVNLSVGTQTSTNGPAISRQVGLRTHGVAARFEYVWIVSRGTGACPPRSS